MGIYMNSPVAVQVPRVSIEDRLEKFLAEQLNYRNEDKKFQLKYFQNELMERICNHGLTDKNLLLGLEINNYLRQIDAPEERFVQLHKVEYHLR